MKNNPPHICDLMKLFLDDKKVPLEYYAIMREYRLILRYSSARQQIYYCPWCGTKLPESVRDSYFEILENEYGIDYPYDNVPKEFQSDDWWIKRGL